MADIKEPVEINDIGKIIQEISQFYKSRKELKDRKLIENIASEEFNLSYNSSMEGLEPVYFWILDFIKNMGCDVEKLVDTFNSSVGSGHFSELMGKGTRMQEESMKIMQTIGILIKSVIQIIYDLRQFKIRLKDYVSASSKDKQESASGIMALKQIWLDNVDAKRGNTGMKAMTFAQQGSFVTLLNAFFAINSIEEIEKSDLNEIVKRVLIQRLPEFQTWRDLSEKELKKRYNMEKSFLRSQVDSLKLYSRWATPYLKAAEQLKMSNSLSTDAALVKAFNTILLQLTLMCKKEIKVRDSVLSHELPSGFEKIKDLKKYYGCVLVDFKFRGIPQKVDQHYAFGGKADVTFRAYALSDAELELLKGELDKSDLKEALRLVEEATTTSLGEIEEDIRYFLDESEEDIGKESKSVEEKKKESKSEDVNPFTALLGIDKIPNILKKEEKPKKKLTAKEEEQAKAKKIEELKKKAKSENYAETEIRNLAEKKAISTGFTVYDVYKKGHGMASVPFM